MTVNSLLGYLFRNSSTQHPAPSTQNPEPRTMPNQAYKKFEIYQLAHQLGIDLHRFSLSLPKYELYETGSQLRRSSKSISANLVEGYGRRRYPAEYVRFLVFAQASCDETAEWLEYIRDLYDDLAGQAANLLVKVDELGAKLNKFIQAVENRSTKPRTN